MCYNPASCALPVRAQQTHSPTERLYVAWRTGGAQTHTSTIRTTPLPSEGGGVQCAVRYGVLPYSMKEG